MNDKITTIDDLKNLVIKFRDDRNWGQHHNPKSLSISIAIEAAELLEHFQWEDQPEKIKKDDIADELADVLIYCLFLAENSNIDISTAVTRKLRLAAKKYPAEKFKNNSLGSKEYYKTKQAHRKK